MTSSSDHLKMIQDFPVYPTLRQISLMADQCGVSDLIAAKKLVHLALATFGAISLPVSVAERLPEPGDCDAEGLCWVWHTTAYTWGLFRLDPTVHSHWLPATALPLPAAEVRA